ncbi:MAG: hypothetical protein OXB91_06250, partial [Bryobacterales bacterium]|nr:hypothetical protein [Bryobacterales bacterium]
MRHSLFPLVLSAAALAAAAAPTTVYISLGEKAESVEAWDGSIRVSGGDLLRLEERHFMGDDELTGESAWTATTREEQIRGFARVNYNEMSPAELPPTQYSPVGLFAVVDGDESTSLRVRTKQGNFAFRVGDLAGGARSFLDGRATASVTPTVERVSGAEYEDDEAAVAQVSDSVAAVAWVAYKDRGDRVLVRLRREGSWEDAQEVTPEPADVWRASAAADGNGRLWVFWSQRDAASWNLWGRLLDGGSWLEPQKISTDGSNTFHRAAATRDGKVVVVWQSAQGEAGAAQSDIWMRVWDGSWGDPLQVSESPANDWEPQVAGGPDGQAHVVWDGYHDGNYDVFYRSYASGELGDIEQVTSSARFQAHANVAVSPDGTPWLAWDESGTNWGKDQGYLVTPPLAVPLHQERSIQVVKRLGASWV